MKSVHKKEISDELKQAVISYKAGNRDTFGAIYVQSQRYIYTCISNVIKGNDNFRDIIEDMMQDTYVEISKSLGQLEDVERFLQWAGTIAARKCYAYLKKSNRYVLLNEEDTTFDDLADDEEFIPEAVMQNAEKRRLIKDIIDSQLNEVQRICIYEFYYNDKKQCQIAEEYGIPENTVKTHLSRAKAKIKEGVLDLEKNKNTRLYGFVPLFSLLFADELANCEVPESVAAKVLSSKALKESLNSMVQMAEKEGIKQNTVRSVTEQVTQKTAKMAGEEMSKSLLGKLAAAGLPAKIAAGTVGIVIVGGLIAGTVFHNERPQDTTEIAGRVQEQTTKATTEVAKTEKEEVTEDEKEITLSDQEAEAVSNFVWIALTVWMAEGSNGTVDFSNDTTLLRFSHIMSNWACYEDDSDFPIRICKTIMSEIGEERKTENKVPYYSIPKSTLRSFWMNIFGTEGGNLENNEYIEIYEVGNSDGDNLEFYSNYNLLRAEVNLNKVVKKKDGSYEITGTTRTRYEDDSGYEERENFCVNAVKRQESPFGFRFQSISFDECNGVDSEVSQEENEFEDAMSAYSNILLYPYRYPEFYPEYNPDQHPDYPVQTEHMTVIPRDKPLWFALADADENGVSELYLAHSVAEDGGFYIVTNVLQYDKASKTVVDLDGDVMFEPNGYNIYLNRGGILYSGSEANVDYTFYYNIFTGELWSNDISSPDWGKEHKAEKVQLEWHEATEDNITSYVK